jgi:ADP-ribosylglycohydrolase
VESGGFDPVDQLRRYVRWYREGHWSSTGVCFDIGLTTREALHRFEASGQTEPYCGSERHDRAGNGSLMRLAPAPMAFARDAVLAVERAADSSRTTHAAAEAVDACRYFGVLLARALEGVGKAELVATRHEPAAGYWEERPLVATVDEVARGSFRERQPPEIRGTGHAVRTLEAAHWAFHHSSDFREGCLLAANLGEDADTTAAVYGQIAGAHYGVGGIPEGWLERLALRAEIEELARRLHALAESGAVMGDGAAGGP